MLFLTSLVIHRVRFLIVQIGRYRFIGWLAAPLTLYCPFSVSLFRGTLILAGGIGVARGVGLGCFGCFLLLFMGNIYVSAFACHATRLDAVQRLEQNKRPVVAPRDTGLIHVWDLSGNTIGETCKLYGIAHLM